MLRPGAFGTYPQFLRGFEHFFQRFRRRPIRTGREPGPRSLPKRELSGDIDQGNTHTGYTFVPEL